MQLILASSSRYRRELLERLDFPFIQQASQTNEDEFKKSFPSPLSLAQQLAKAKAQDVARANPSALVIGSDQVCCFGEKIYSKAGTIEVAKNILNELSGKTHHLHTAVSLICLEKKIEIIFAETVIMKMRQLELSEIDRYLELDQPIDCAGCYKIESHGISLFESIECRDHTAIIGLPLMALNQHLLKLLPRD
jgi:septum formation protein